jgi:hypothetical protein
MYYIRGSEVGLDSRMHHTRRVREIVVSIYEDNCSIESGRGGVFGVRGRHLRHGGL